MKHNIESSLKRFLKRKVKITMGFVVAFLITGTVGFAEADYYAKDKEVSVEKAEDITAKLIHQYQLKIIIDLQLSELKINIR